MKKPVSLYRYGVKTEETLAAHRVYFKRYKTAREAQGPLLVDSRPALNACRYALEAGINRAEIAAAAGVHPDYMDKLLNGRKAKVRRSSLAQIVAGLERLADERRASLDLLEESLRVIKVSVQLPGTMPVKGSLASPSPTQWAGVEVPRLPAGRDF